MTVLAVWERLVLHLGRYDGIDPDDAFNAPWDLTQDGIASSLRISRAHASMELKKLKMTDKVIERQVHIKGGKNKRKAYFLTPTGMADASRIKDYAEEEGIDIMPLLDMRRCDPNALLDSMDGHDKWVLELACILRCSVRRDTLPDTTQSVLPVDVAGNVMMSDDVKGNVLAVLDPETLKELHSAAADYWISSGDVQERLYHLVRAGRMNDACRLLLKIDTDDMDDDLCSTVAEMDVPERFARSVLPVKISSAIRSGDLDSAESLAADLMEIDREAGCLMSADIMLARGRPSDVRSVLSGIRDSVGKDMRIVKAMILSDRLDDAMKMITEIRPKVMASGDLDLICDVCIMQSEICIMSGTPEDAVVFLNKAKNGAGPKEMKRIYAMMSKVYGSMEAAEDLKCM